MGGARLGVVTGAVRNLVGGDGGEADAGGVVDGDAHILPAGARGVDLTIAGDAVALAAEAAELLDVQMQQVAGAILDTAWSALPSSNGTGTISHASQQRFLAARDGERHYPYNQELPTMFLWRDPEANWSTARMAAFTTSTTVAYVKHGSAVKTPTRARTSTTVVSGSNVGCFS